MYAYLEYDNGNSVEMFYTLESELEKLCDGASIIACDRKQCTLYTPGSTVIRELIVMSLSDGQSVYFVDDDREVGVLSQIIAFKEEPSANDLPV